MEKISLQFNNTYGNCGWKMSWWKTSYHRMQPGRKSSNETWYLHVNCVATTLRNYASKSKLHKKSSAYIVYKHNLLEIGWYRFSIPYYLFASRREKLWQSMNLITDSLSRSQREKWRKFFFVSLLKISNPYFARVTQFTGAADSITDDQLHLLHSLVTSDHLVASFSVECDAVFRDSQTN